MFRYLLPLSAIVCVVQGCTNLGDGDVPEQEQLGRISAALQLPDLFGDVSGVHVAVVPQDASCKATPLFVADRKLEKQALPASLAEGAGSFRPFADALFVLPAGTYRVCATPLAGEQPSAQCGLAETEVTVKPKQTEEVLLLSHCSAESTGGLDVIVALNQPPRITAVNLNPGKFISTCEALDINVEAEDPNQDKVSFDFTLSAGSAAAHLRSDGAHANFFGPAGDYELEIVASDPHGQDTSLSFPIHVSEATCTVPAQVQDIFVANCSPCHVTGSSGRLSLATAAASYANLVGTSSSAAACGARVRVIPGDPGQSYLLAKLRGETGICGAPMPRGKPPLSEADLSAISAWITALPH